MKLLSTSISSVLALGFLAAAPSTAQALTWDGGAGTWNTTNLNWNGGTASWGAGGPASLAQFPNTGAAAVTIGDDLNIGQISFNTAGGAGVGSGPYTFTNGFTVDFTGPGIITSAGNAQTFTNNGTINFKNSSSARDVLSTGAGAITISNNSTLNFLDTSTAGGAVINNTAALIFGNTALGGTASIFNGGSLDVSGNTVDDMTFEIVPGTAGPLTFGSLTNSDQLGDGAGLIVLGAKTLTVGNVTLASGFGANSQSINFTLAAPGATSGQIKLTAGSIFSGSLNGETDIKLSSFGPVTPGTYTLIDWTGSTAPGVNIEDFNLIGPLPGGLLPSSQLVINGSTLQLVAVPEPSTFMMPVVAVLGMAWMRRRVARATV